MAANLLEDLIDIIESLPVEIQSKLGLVNEQDVIVDDALQEARLFQDRLTEVSTTYDLFDGQNGRDRQTLITTIRNRYGEATAALDAKMAIAAELKDLLKYYQALLNHELALLGAGGND